jgi:rhodanese-related sulfurtransferase
VTLRKYFKVLFTTVPRVAPNECADRIRAGATLLVDVREADEWPAGVADNAALLPLSDLYRSRQYWNTFLETVGDRELVLYCGAGVRSNFAARLLKAEGFRVANGGGFSDWAAAGWPIVRPGG